MHLQIQAGYNSRESNTDMFVHVNMQLMQVHVERK